MASDDSDVELGSLTRRRALQIGAGFGAAGLAGCGGDGGDTPADGEETVEETTAGTVTMDDEGTTTLHSMVGWGFAPTDMTLNRWGPTPYPGGQFNVFFTPILSYSFVEDKYLQELGRDIPYMENCTMHVPMKKGEYIWWNGMEVKAGDRVYGHQLASHMCCGGPDEVPWAAQFGKDDYEYKETKVGVMNEEFRKQNMKDRGPDFRRDVWKPYWERMQDASSDEEVNQITEDVRAVDLTLPKVIEKGYGYGLWKPVDFASDFVEFEQWEKHPRHGQSNIDRWRWHVISNQQSKFQAIEQDTLDTTAIQLDETDQVSAPSDMEEIYEYSSFQAMRVGMSWRNKHLRRRGVRRAINYILDREQIKSVVQGSGAIPQDHQVTGGPGPLIRELIGEDFVKNTIQYGVNSKPEKAKQAMRNAGYSLQDGDWVGPDGDTMDLKFISRSNSQDALIANTLSGVLNSFGIGNQLLTLEATSFGNQVQEKYEFDLELNISIARGPAKGPFFDVHHPIEGLPETAATSDPEVCDKMPDPDDPKTFAGRDPYEKGEGNFKGWAPPHRIPANPFPPYPGLDNLGSTMELPQVYDGEGAEIDPHQTALNLRLQFPDDYLLRKAREYAWWYNYNAFHAYMFTFSRSQWMDTSNFRIRDGATLRGSGTGHNPVNWGDVLTK